MVLTMRKAFGLSSCYADWIARTRNGRLLALRAKAKFFMFPVSYIHRTMAPISCFAM